MNEKLQDIIRKMKNNYALLNGGDENSFFYSRENKSGIQKTRKLSTILNENFRKFRRNNSVILRSPCIKTEFKKKVPNHKMYSIKHNSFLNDIRKINPKINLNYVIELYEKKGRYSLVKKDEIIYEDKYDGKDFLKQNFKNSFSYRPTLFQKGNQNFYKLTKKSISYGRFRPLNYKENINTNSSRLDEINLINKYIDNIGRSNKKDNKVRIRPKSSTKPSTIVSNSSRAFSAKIYGERGKFKGKRNLINFKNKNEKLKNKIDKVFEKANNASIELNKDIYESKNYDKLYKLVEKPKKNKNNKNYKVKYINKKGKKKDNNDLYKYLDIEKNVENKMIKSYKYFDKIGKKILQQAMEQDKKHQFILNKKQDTKNLILNSRFFIKKLQKELGVLGADILAAKKKYKGEEAIEPNNEIIFLHKLIKENMLKNLNDEEYLGEAIKRKNISESMSNKIKKRLLSLQQKSLSIKNKIRENDFSYL